MKHHQTILLSLSLVFIFLSCDSINGIDPIQRGFNPNVENGEIIASPGNALGDDSKGPPEQGEKNKLEILSPLQLQELAVETEYIMKIRCLPQELIGIKGLEEQEDQSQFICDSEGELSVAYQFETPGVKEMAVFSINDTSNRLVERIVSVVGDVGERVLEIMYPGEAALFDQPVVQLMVNCRAGKSILIAGDILGNERKAICGINNSLSTELALTMGIGEKKISVTEVDTLPLLNDTVVVKMIESGPISGGGGNGGINDDRTNLAFLAPMNNEIIPIDTPLGVSIECQANEKYRLFGDLALEYEFVCPMSNIYEAKTILLSGGGGLKQVVAQSLTDANDEASVVLIVSRR
jgi:hypothetical protein